MVFDQLHGQSQTQSLSNLTFTSRHTCAVTYALLSSPRSSRAAHSDLNFSEDMNFIGSQYPAASRIQRAETT